MTLLKGKMAVIGCGNMGGAFLAGVIRAERITPKQITVTSRTIETLNSLHERFGVSGTLDNKLAVNEADLVVFSVKPNVLLEVLEELKESLKGKLVISLVPGVTIDQIQNIIGGEAVVRAMPNLPVACGEGVIGYLRNEYVDAEMDKVLREFLEDLGLVVEVMLDHDLEIITLFMGCGPGVVAALIVEMTKKAREFGLPEAVASSLVMQVFYGTMDYLRETALLPEELLQEVATKNGVTEAIVKSLEKNVFDKPYTAGAKKLFS